MHESIAARLHALRDAVDAELRACGREPGSVAILGVSKKQPAEAIVEAVNAGLRDIGENYVQEARTKLSSPEVLSLPKDVRKHFIGHVQTNKAKSIVEVFDVVQSVDRLDAGIALAKAARSTGKLLRVLLQVNISPSERFGCPPGDAERLADALRSHESLVVDGVMAIGPITDDREEILAAFGIAAKTFGAVGGSTLSIGMSGDWREAIRAGSTMIRIGTALFGTRPNQRT